MLHWAPSFEEGIASIQAERFDICFVDYRIGGRTGLDFLTEATKLGHSGPVVFLTGMGDRSTDIAAMEAGAADFLQKSELTAAILDRTIRYSVIQARNRREIAEQASLLKATLENTGAAIAAVDADGRLIAWNDRFVHFLSRVAKSGGAVGTAGPDEAELKNLKLADRFPLFSGSLDEYDCGEGCIMSICRNPTAEGGHVIVCHDVTATKQAELALRQAMREAQAASAAKTAFLANMSHELRTPLNAIIGFSELMLNEAHGPVGSSEYEDYVAFIRDSGASLLRVINSALDLARVHAGEYRLEIAPLNVGEVLASVVSQYSAIARTRKLVIDVRVTPQDLMMQGDESALAKLLGQLLSNAVKFSPDGGHVSIHATRPDAGHVCIAIHDSGIGMDAADIRRALLPFGQVDQDLTRKYEGAGLGLPLAKAFTELHGGTLHIESTHGKGTLVTVSFPVETSCDAFAHRRSRPRATA